MKQSRRTNLINTLLLWEFVVKVFSLLSLNFIAIPLYAFVQVDYSLYFIEGFRVTQLVSNQ